MGSYLSSSQKETIEPNKTFAIDLDEKGDQPKPVKKPKKKKRRANSDKKTTDPSQEAKMAETSQQTEQQEHYQGSTGLASLATSEMPSGLPQLIVLSGMPKTETKKENDIFSINELDAILEKMKAKYRPRPVVLSGKSRSVFDEVERNLVNCYTEHKDKPLECSRIVREYNAFVAKQRDRILSDASRKDSPIFT